MSRRSVPDDGVSDGNEKVANFETIYLANWNMYILLDKCLSESFGDAPRHFRVCALPMN